MSLTLLRIVLHLIVIQLTICILSCSNSDRKQNNVNSAELLLNHDDIDYLQIDNLEPKSTIYLDSIIDSVYYVPFQTTDSSIIGSINEVIIGDEYMFVLDKYQTESIFIFDKSGIFLNKIHRIGKGPGEYSQPYDIDYNEQTREIYLLNGFPQKIIKYNLAGEFTGEINLPIRFSSFKILPDKSIALLNEPNMRKYGNPQNHFNGIFSRILIITPGGEFLYTGGDVNREYENINSTKSQFGIMGSGIISFQPGFCDTFFQITDRNVVPQLVIDFKDHKIKSEIMAGKSFEEYTDLSSKLDYYEIYGQHVQTDELLFFIVDAASQKRSYFSYYSKENRAALIFSKSENGPFNPINILPITSSDNFFISIVGAEQIMEVKDLLNNNKDETTLKFAPPPELLDRIDENSNPVLAFYTLRPEKINSESVYLTRD